ncbi:SAM-dependent chlorinase/fluorinase [Candidatus Poribacteria bacterium]|nr:SAM-dependent chlorinase/fluorinase [Candidatus Poribacteria bacterium]MYG05924.1 SAM-dependent chlorinase/fluorinase [Candidatus Poribacteria bacterium]MYK21871.1 SAM-dependent chlorinase/fluorinase [Candidatus Poribacteria bacterium]
MNASTRLITLTTDFGTSDAYVGIMKGVILGINPDVQVVDVTHAIAPQDIYAAALSIHSAHRYFPEGTIHTIVVDPSVGSDRRAVICQTDRAFFVCPDNGILTYLLHEIENADGQLINAVAIQNKAYYLPEVSNTFHGRDIFAPVAAHLSLGVPLANIGPPVEDLVQLPIPIHEVSGNTIIGQIVKIDRFGNAITNISESVLAGIGSTYEIRVGSTRLMRLNRAYAESGIGKPLAIIGSFGLLEIAINGGSAEVSLGLKWGDAVEIQRSD